MNKPSRLEPQTADQSAFTVREYCQMLEAGAFGDIKVELVRGNLRKMMPSSFSHGEMNARLLSKLVAAFAGTDRRFAVDLAIQIDALTVRGGDIVVVLPDVPETGLVPANYVVLVVEIAVTTLGTDLGEKLADYARAGVPHYWVCDIDARVMHVMCLPEGDRYRTRTVVSFSDPLAVPGTDRSITID